MSSEPAAQPNSAGKTAVLSELKPGERGRVTVISLPGSSRARIMEMGLTVGATVELVRFAPLGDPIEFKVRGFHLSLRKAEAATITVERLN